MSMFSREKLARWRLSKLFFYIFLIALPFQTRKIFFTDNSFYFDYFSFYNAWYLYLTDLLFLCIIVGWIVENVWFSRLPTGQAVEKSKGSPSTLLGASKKRLLEKVSNDPTYLFLLAFWLILATSLLFSRENSLGLYGLVKITEFMLLFVYVREEVNFLPPHRKPAGKSGGETAQVWLGGEREKVVVFWLILVASSFQAGLAIWQYLNQYSAGLRYLGEEFLRPGLSGLAEFPSNGVVNPAVAQFLPNLSTIPDGFSFFMRAYGTFPHPNVLAGFLFFGILASLYLLYFSPPHSIPPHSWGRKGGGVHVKTLVLSLSLILLTTGQVVTFSRLAWVVTGLATLALAVLVVWRVRNRDFLDMKTGRLAQAGSYRPVALGVILLSLLLSLALNWFLFGQQIQDRLGLGEQFAEYTSDESFVDRAKFNNVAVEMIKNKPLFGVGLRNFVVTMDDYAEERLLPYLHQPVHNIYLLIAAESGILALIVFVIFLLNIVRPAFSASWRIRAGKHAIRDDSIQRYALVLTFLGFLVIGFFDHYLWTIQQGMLMFWVALGLLANKNA